MYSIQISTKKLDREVRKWKYSTPISKQDPLQLSASDQTEEIPKRTRKIY